jgi:hypothetical protein
VKKRIRAGKFVMTILGACLIGSIPAWVNGCQVECRTEREYSDVWHYAGMVGLNITWASESDLEIATITL